MLKKWVSCPCWGSDVDADDGADGEAVDRDPVLLISGIAGSILHSKDKKSSSETRVWVRIFLSSLFFKQKLWSLYNPDTGYTEPLDDGVEILVPEDDHGLYAIDILDPSWFVKLFHLTKLYHFHDMIEMLVGCGYKKGATLFGYGYDFRQSNRIDKLIEGLQKKLKTAYKASGGRRVNIISHSMGGLLVSCFMSLHSEVFAKYVNKWIAIATPFQGAPGCINDSILTGLQFVEGLESHFFVSRWTMHQLLIECPSIYEMMANPDFKWKKQPQIQVWHKKSENGDTSVEFKVFGPIESIDLFSEALKNNELSYGGNKIALPFNFAILKWAIGTMQIVNKAQVPDGVSFFNIFGVSYDTPFDVCYGTETSPIKDFSEICHTVPEYTYVDGDGTVPAESAEAGFKAVASVGVSASHRGLLSDKRVFELIQQWLGVEPTEKARRRKDSSSTHKVVNAAFD